MASKEWPVKYINPSGSNKVKIKDGILRIVEDEVCLQISKDNSGKHGITIQLANKHTIHADVAEYSCEPKQAFVIHWKPSSNAAYRKVVVIAEEKNVIVSEINKLADQHGSNKSTRYHTGNWNNGKYDCCKSTEKETEGCRFTPTNEDGTSNKVVNNNSAEVNFARQSTEFHGIEQSATISSRDQTAEIRGIPFLNQKSDSQSDDDECVTNEDRSQIRPNTQENRSSVGHKVSTIIASLKKSGKNNKVTGLDGDSLLKYDTGVDMRKHSHDFTQGLHVDRKLSVVAIKNSHTDENYDTEQAIKYECATSNGEHSNNNEVELLKGHAIHKATTSGSLKFADHSESKPKTVDYQKQDHFVAQSMPDLKLENVLMWNNLYKQGSDVNTAELVKKLQSELEPDRSLIIVISNNRFNDMNIGTDNKVIKGNHSNLTSLESGINNSIGTGSQQQINSKVNSPAEQSMNAGGGVCESENESVMIESQQEDDILSL